MKQSSRCRLALDQINKGNKFSFFSILSNLGAALINYVVVNNFNVKRKGFKMISRTSGPSAPSF